MFHGESPAWSSAKSDELDAAPKAGSSEKREDCRLWAEVSMEGSSGDVPNKDMGGGCRVGLR